MFAPFLRLNVMRTCIAVLLLLIVSVNFLGITAESSIVKSSSSDNDNTIRFAHILIKASMIPQLIGKSINSIYGVATCINGSMELGAIYVLPTELIGGVPVLNDTTIKPYHVFLIQLPYTTIGENPASVCDWGIYFAKNRIHKRIAVTLRNYFQLQGARISKLNNIKFYIYYDEEYSNLTHTLPLEYYKYLTRVFGVEYEKPGKLNEVVGQVIDQTMRGVGREILVESEERIAWILTEDLRSIVSEIKPGDDRKHGIDASALPGNILLDGGGGSGSNLPEKAINYLISLLPSERGSTSINVANLYLGARILEAYLSIKVKPLSSSSIARVEITYKKYIPESRKYTPLYTDTRSYSLDSTDIEYRFTIFLTNRIGFDNNTLYGLDVRIYALSGQINITQATLVITKGYYTLEMPFYGRPSIESFRHLSKTYPITDYYDYYYYVVDMPVNIPNGFIYTYLNGSSMYVPMNITFELIVDLATGYEDKIIEFEYAIYVNNQLFKTGTNGLNYRKIQFGFGNRYRAVFDVPISIHIDQFMLKGSQALLKVLVKSYGLAPDGTMFNVRGGFITLRYYVQTIEELWKPESTNTWIRQSTPAIRYYRETQYIYASLEWYTYMSIDVEGKFRLYSTFPNPILIYVIVNHTLQANMPGFTIIVYSDTPIGLCGYSVVQKNESSRAGNWIFSFITTGIVDLIVDYGFKTFSEILNILIKITVNTFLDWLSEELSKRYNISIEIGSTTNQITNQYYCIITYSPSGLFSGYMIKSLAIAVYVNVDQGILYHNLVEQGEDYYRYRLWLGSDEEPLIGISDMYYYASFTGPLEEAFSNRVRTDVRIP